MPRRKTGLTVNAAGLNLQKECYNLILYSSLYVGDGGITGDPVADASTEQQAIGRVFRPGQLRPEVSVYRIELQGPKGEECLDGYLIRRNTDENTLAAPMLPLDKVATHDLPAPSPLRFIRPGYPPMRAGAGARE